MAKNNCGKAKALTRQAILVFANSSISDCQRRKWPSVFQQLFKTTNYAELATGVADVHIFASAPLPSSENAPYTVHVQHCARSSFGEKLEAAVSCLAGLGYGKIVIIGSDCPTLAPRDVLQAFTLLEHDRLVLGPDHRGGCYLIGLHAEDREQLAGIRWRQNTDFAELLRRYGVNATAQLPVKLDLDTLEDIRLLAGAACPWSAVATVLLTFLRLRDFAPERLLRRSKGRQQKLSWQRPPPFQPAF